MGAHFAPYPYVFSEDGFTGTEYLQIRPAVHLPQFWAPVLSAVGVACRTPPSVGTALSPNRMRKSLGNAWGADIFMGRS